MGNNNKFDLVKRELSEPNEEYLDSPSKHLWKCVLSEFIGSILLIFIGCGGGIRVGAVGENIEFYQGQPLVCIALVWGFIVCSLAQTLGHISCDINPAITLAFLVTGQTTILKAIIYIIVQCAGSACGAYLLKLLMPLQFEGNYGMNTVSPLITPVQALFIELVATFLLVFVVFGTNDKDRKDIKGSTALSIGIAVAGIIFAIQPMTSASLNPARSFGPCLVALNFKNYWVFLIGPISGGLLGGILYHTLFRTPKMQKDTQKNPERGNGLSVDPIKA